MIVGTVERSVSPFPADAGIARRMAGLAVSVGAAVARDIAAITGAAVAGAAAVPAGGGAIVPAAEAARLVSRHGLASSVELALLALPVAAAIAQPPISGYRVGAVGIEAETGDLVLGGNLEFPGSDLSTTVHAEGFVSLRARRRGATLGTLAITKAQPCAHCRQTLAESAGADLLRLVDPLGHVLALRDLYPWPFMPAALGVGADAPDRATWPDLAFMSTDHAGRPPADVTTALMEAGRLAHAPYSRGPSAVVLLVPDGRLVGAGCVESVAFNPSISGLQAALVELTAAGIDPTVIAEGWLAKVEGGVVDPEPGFRALLAAVAPNAVARVARWRVDG